MHEETLSTQTKSVFELIKDSVPEFYLAGGTALALQLGHRISVDLDFFTKDNFKTDDIVQRLNKKGKFIVTSQENRTLNGELNNVKISFFQLPYKMIFDTKDFLGVRLADEREIAAMKILAISDRGSKKDFIDLYVLLKKYSLVEILEFFDKKYYDYNYNMLHILKSFTFFDDADLDEEPIYIKKIDWKSAKKYIQSIIINYLNKS